MLYVVLIWASEVVGMVGAPGRSVFGSLLPKSWPNACWTERKAGGLLAAPEPCLEVASPGAALYS